MVHRLFFSASFVGNSQKGFIHEHLSGAFIVLKGWRILASMAIPGRCMLALFSLRVIYFLPRTCRAWHVPVSRSLQASGNIYHTQLVEICIKHSEQVHSKSNARTSDTQKQARPMHDAASKVEYQSLDRWNSQRTCLLQFCETRRNHAVRWRVVCASHKSYRSWASSDEPGQ